MSVEPTARASRKPALRDKILNTLRHLKRADDADADSHQAPWRALQPANVALHLSQDPNPEGNAVHRLLPDEHVTKWAQRRDREQQAAEERAMKPPPLLCGPVPRQPTDFDKMTREERERLQKETDVSDLLPLQRDVYRLMSGLEGKKAAYFHPATDRKQDILLVKEVDLAPMQRIHFLARGMLEDERHDLCSSMGRFINQKQTYILKKLMFNPGIKIVTSTQDWKLDATEMKQVTFNDAPQQLLPEKVREPVKQPANNTTRTRIIRPTTENFFTFVQQVGHSPPESPSPRSSHGSHAISINRTFAVEHSDMPEELRSAQHSADSAIADFLRNTKRASDGDTIETASSRLSNLRHTQSSISSTMLRSFPCSTRTSEDQSGANAHSEGDDSLSALPSDRGRSSGSPSTAVDSRQVIQSSASSVPFLSNSSRGRSSVNRPARTHAEAAVPDFLLDSRINADQSAAAARSEARAAKGRRRYKTLGLRGGGDEEERSTRTWHIISNAVLRQRVTRPLPDGHRLPSGLVWLAGGRVQGNNIMTVADAREGRRRVREKRGAMEAEGKSRCQPTTFLRRLYSKQRAGCTATPPQISPPILMERKHLAARDGLPPSSGPPVLSKTETSPGRNSELERSDMQTIPEAAEDVAPVVAAEASMQHDDPGAEEAKRDTSSFQLIETHATPEVEETTCQDHAETAKRPESSTEQNGQARNGIPHL